MNIKKESIMKIFDYLIPCSLIAIALVVSMLIINSSGLLGNHNIENVNKEANQQNDINIGLLRKNGKLFINTLSGRKIYVPNYFKRKIEETVVDYLVTFNETKDSNFLTNQPQDHYSSVFFTKQYSLLLLAISQEMKEKDSQATYLTFAIYAEKIADLEQKLTSIRNEISESIYEYEINKLYYKKAAQNWNNIWARKFQCIKTPDTKGCPVSQLDIINAYTDFNNTYITYRKAIKDLKQKNKLLAPQAKEYYHDLKKQTGSNFDLLLSSISQDKKVSSYVSNLAEALGEEIKYIKNRIKLTTSREDELTSYIEFNNPNIKETISFFDTINITINGTDVNDIKCLAGCINDGKTDCNNYCQ